MGYISIILSGVASLGVFVALISGIFFLVLSGLRWVSKVRSAFYEEELLRQNKRRPLSKSCFNSGDGTWNLMETNEDQQNFLSKDYLRNNTSDALENWKEEKDEENDKQQSKFPRHTLLFRELIEKKIEEIIGSSLDGIPVGRLSTHSSYLIIFSKYHSLLCQEIEKLGLALQSSILNKNVIDSKVLNHQILDLKKLLKQIISDVTSLPFITDILLEDEITNSSNYDDIHDKTYEDILATAILNKTIGYFQSNTDSDILSLYQSNCTKAKTSETDEVESVSSSGSSDFSRSENLSFTLEDRLEEITNEYDLSDGDETADCEFESNLNKPSLLEPGNVLESEVLFEDKVLKEPEEEITEKETVNSTSSWEDNWLFQKKRFRSTPNVHHPVPVPMLVPKPSNNIRALVGGVDADDLSDMSDCSDSVFESRLITVTTPDLNDSSNESDKIESDTGDTSKITEPIPTDIYKPENNCQSKEFASENLENNFTDDRDLGEENCNWSENTNSNFTLLRTKANTLPSPTKEKEEMEYLVENVDIRKRDEFHLITNLLQPGVNNTKKEYFMAENDSKESSNFLDVTTSNLFDEKKFGEYCVTRDYYINASKNPSGMISPKPLTRFSEEIEQAYTPSNTVSQPSSKEYATDRIETTDQNKMFVNNNFTKKKVFSLPNVKELAEQFMSHELTASSQAITKRGTKVEDKSLTKQKSPDAMKYNGKQVHSLTARSISKEFREGLKSNLCQKSLAKPIAGEAKAENIICHERSPSPTPTINLQSIKKFWEEIITANSTPKNL